ncbi:hypothetical protein AB1N83_010090 [Pleurotus pulmonarius]
MKTTDKLRSPTLGQVHSDAGGGIMPVSFERAASLYNVDQLTGFDLMIANVSQSPSGVYTFNSRFLCAIGVERLLRGLCRLNALRVPARLGVSATPTLQAATQSSPHRFTRSWIALADPAPKSQYREY